MVHSCCTMSKRPQIRLERDFENLPGDQAALKWSRQPDLNRRPTVYELPRREHAGAPGRKRPILRGEDASSFVNATPRWSGFPGRYGQDYGQAEEGPPNVRGAVCPAPRALRTQPWRRDCRSE